MKESKVVKRAVNQALQEAAFTSLTKAQAADSLRAFLARGEAAGFVVRDGRIAKSPATAVVQEPHPQPPKKKRKNSQANADAVSDPSPGQNGTAGTMIADYQQPVSASQPTANERREKKQKMQGSGAAAVEPAPAEQPVPAAQEAPSATEQPSPVRSAETSDDAEDLAWRASLMRRDVKAGPFSAAENATLHAAMAEYADSKGFSTTDYSWLIVAGRGSRGHSASDTVGVWKSVAAKLPHRTVKSVAAAGLRMFHPHARKGKWTEEQEAELLALVEERGRKWTSIGLTLERTGDSCRDRWKEIRLGTRRATGPWEASEEEMLKAAVQEYLDAGHAAGGGSAGGGESGAGGDVVAVQRGEGVSDGRGEVAEGLSRRMVLDDIDWHAVSTKVGTRSNLQCLEKWYDQLSPSMVARGEWGAGDDRRMLRALWTAAPGAEYEVKWAELVAGRTAAQARRRWRLMAKTVGDHRDKEFPEILDALVSKHLPLWKQAAAEAAAAAEGAGQQQQ